MNTNMLLLSVLSVYMTSADATPLDELAAPAVPEVHISAHIMAVITLCVASVTCLFGYQSHSLVFCYSGYIVGHSLFAVVYLSSSAGVALAGWYAWAAIATGVVFSIIAIANSRVGLTTTAVAVGTAAAGFLSPIMLPHIAFRNQALIVGLTWCATVVVAIVLICVAPKPTLIGGTAGLGAYFVVESVATLGWSASMFLANGLHTSEMYAFYIATTVLFLVGLVTQWALSRGDEFDVHGRRRFYPTTFRYAVKKNTQPRVEENTGTQLVYGV